MVRSYLRHGQVEAFGLVASPAGNCLFNTSGKAFVCQLEDVGVIDCKTGEQVAMWHETGLKSDVTCLAQSPAQKDVFAVGYANGSIRLWSSATNSVIVTFDGHKKQVTALAFDEQGTRLASGSQDTDVILWDVLGESGLFRLRGHRDQITSLAFLSSSHLLSASKDTLIKLWHLPTQHCLDTAVAHRSECWSITALPNATIDVEADNIGEEPSTATVMSSGGEGELKLWSINLASLPTSSDDPSTSEKATSLRSIHALAAPTLSSTSHAHRIPSIHFDPNTQMLAVQTGDRTVELARVRTVEEMKKKAARRKKREKEKGKKEAAAEAEEASDEIEWKERIASWVIVRSPTKIRSFSIATPSSSREARGKGRAKEKSEFQILFALNNNSLQTYSVPLPDKATTHPEATLLHNVSTSGHRTDVRSLSLSSDDALLAAVSNGELKIWNRRSLKCLRTMNDTGYGLCCSWLPGDRHIVVGTKSGSLELYDVASSSLLESFPSAHDGPVWSVQVRPDGRGLVSGSADSNVKFWDFEVREVKSGEEVDGQQARAKVLTMIHSRTLKMTDDVLSVRYSPDGKLLAVSLLDSTVKVFFQDTLKFFLSLYGHKLPVLSMDISHDSKMIITCSADKNIKIWGLDFGDCHRSLFAHDDSVMQVAFEADSHYFWSVGKDKLLKYWDGDKFECIQKLEGHHGEIWALTASHKGRFVVTAGSDKSIRIWEKTDEPLFLEEERERELEELYDSNLPSNDPFEMNARKDGETLAGPEATDVRKQTAETLTAGEKIIEALDMSTEERQALREYEDQKASSSLEVASKLPPPARNPILAYQGADFSSEAYVLQVVQKVPSAALHDALLVLPFSKVVLLIEHLDHWAQQRWNIPLTSRILFFLLKTHHSQIVATRAMRDSLLSMRSSLREALQQQKNIMGYNHAALKFIRRQHEENRTATLLEKSGLTDEEAIRKKLDESVKKRKRAVL